MESWRAHARWAAIGWLGVAVLSGVLTSIGIANGSESPELAGLALAAPLGLISLLSAIRLFLAPSTGALLGATIWAGLNLAFGVWASLTGAGLAALAFLVVVAGTGIESYQAWIGRRAVPKEAMEMRRRVLLWVGLLVTWLGALLAEQAAYALGAHDGCIAWAPNYETCAVSSLLGGITAGGRDGGNVHLALLVGVVAIAVGVGAALFSRWRSAR